MQYALEPQFQLDSVDDLNLLGGLPILVCSACCRVIGKPILRRDPLSPMRDTTPTPTPITPHYTHAHSLTHMALPSVIPLHRRVFAHGPLALPHIVILPADSTTRHVLVEWKPEHPRRASLSSSSCLYEPPTANHPRPRLADSL